MPTFIPFKAIRPPREYVHLVGSRSYMNYNQEDILDRLKGNPYSFLHVIMSEEMTLRGDELSLDEKFNMVSEKFTQFVDNGYLHKDQKSNFYLYRQTKDGHKVEGIIGAIATDNYLEGKIKIHEQTITKRENLFKKYLEKTGFNAEPVLLTYEDNENINDLVSKYLKKRPEYIFATTDQVKHEFWVIKKKKHKTLFQEEFLKVDQVYIADGHHRCASSALLAKDNPEVFSQQHFMALMVPKSRLKILDFNRMVKDLNGLSPDEILKKIENCFTITPQISQFEPQHIHNFSMYLDRKWYSLIIKPEFLDDNIVGRLDPQILTDRILTPILGIKDLKTDERIDFLNGTLGMEGLQNKVDSNKYKVAFGLYPITFDQLKEVSDNNYIMPPKSTWIEPKLRSGIIVYEIFKD